MLTIAAITGITGYLFVLFLVVRRTTGKSRELIDAALLGHKVDVEIDNSFGYLDTRTGHVTTVVNDLIGPTPPCTCGTGFIGGTGHELWDSHDDRFSVSLSRDDTTDRPFADLCIAECDGSWSRLLLCEERLRALAKMTGEAVTFLDTHRKT